MIDFGTSMLLEDNVQDSTPRPGQPPPRPLKMLKVGVADGTDNRVMETS